jgi:hypothetical protein
MPSRDAANNRVRQLAVIAKRDSGMEQGNSDLYDDEVVADSEEEDSYYSQPLAVQSVVKNSGIFCFSLDKCSKIDMPCSISCSIFNTDI